MNTPIPLDQLFVDRMVLLLSAIATAGGYHTDAGSHVLTEQSRDGIPDDAITLAVIDSTEDTAEPKGQRFKTRSGRLRVSVEIQLPVTKLVAGVPEPQPVRRQARLAMADVRRAVAMRDLTDFIPGITGLAIQGRSLPLLEEGSNYQQARVDFDVLFNESHLPKE